MKMVLKTRYKRCHNIKQSIILGDEIPENSSKYKWEQITIAGNLHY